MRASTELTDLLIRAGAGDRAALDAVLPLVYAELRGLAERQLRGEVAGHTLSPTALVHEAWLRVAGGADAPGGPAGLAGRAQFFALAATVMRRILVDHARRHRAAKRGGARVRVELADIAELPAEERATLVVALDESLARLAALDRRQAQVIECRFFGGLTE
ncbi:MAG: ECF-type sigma factor, partial [Gemmatimonadaceae bacterium]|nr:ECF-type sigma factor [Gemmatimonadaceae bacterium]